MSEPAASGQVVAEGAEPDSSPEGPLPPSMVSVDQLTAHPANVREDLGLTPEFLASVADTGVRIPLLVTPHDDGGFLVIEGHRRLAAAVQAGLAEVPCVLNVGRDGDRAGQFLDMLVANGEGHRKNFAPVEEAAALFAAHEAGASRTRIRKATGRKAEEVKTALAAGRISGETRAAAGELASQLNLDQLALLAEFDGDQDAVTKILEALRHGYTVEYVAERIRQDRADAAEHERLRAELEAAGIQVTSELPAGAARLASLTHDGDGLTPETHAGCPRRGAFFPSWNLRQPVHYCADPAGHGHAFRSLVLPRPEQNGACVDPSAPLPGSDDDPAPDPDRKLVIEGNRAWAAAAEVRKRWLQQLLARRTAPAEVARFIAGQLLTMPEPLRLGLGTAHMKPLFAEITGCDAGRALDSSGTCQPSRLPLLMLAPVVAAYEGEIYGTDASRRATWREDRYSPCPRRDAGRYLAFLASLGYPLAPIERAVADGVPYTGDTPAGPDLVTTGGDPGGQADGEGDGVVPEEDGDGQGGASPEAV
ncbi:MAG TPA: ParB/RepB/Spo0J family partition protein [Streptosporangiaceae bacterium]|nr:ParB/RepB/Spo0J family partition protein [Streptosporangiaceae bacterium]